MTERDAVFPASRHDLYVLHNDSPASHGVHSFCLEFGGKVCLYWVSARSA